MNRRPDYLRTIESQLQLTDRDRAALRRGLQGAIVSALRADHEAMPETEAVIAQLVRAFEAGRARQVADQIQTALIQIAVADIGGPVGLFTVVDAAVMQHEEARHEALQLFKEASVSSSPQRFAELLRDDPPTILAVMELVRLGVMAGVRGRQGTVASFKNAAARAWVQAEWKAHRAEYDNNKTAFAAVYSKLVADNYPWQTDGKDHKKGDPMRINATTIATRWLPKD